MLTPLQELSLPRATMRERRVDRRSGEGQERSLQIACVEFTMYLVLFKNGTCRMFLNVGKQRESLQSFSQTHPRMV